MTYKFPLGLEQVAEISRRIGVAHLKKTWTSISTNLGFWDAEDIQN